MADAADASAGGKKANRKPDTTKLEPIAKLSKTSSKAKANNDALVIKKLKSIYREKLLPVEKTYLFHKFNQPEILDSELGAKATVLLIGQYSTG
jgi:hypothetical protein